MSTGVIIVLIIVVWLFVLAPWILRTQRPVRHTGEAFEETRVLFTGNSGSVNSARRPRLGRLVKSEDVDPSLEPADDVVEDQFDELEYSQPDEVELGVEASALDSQPVMTFAAPEVEAAHEAYELDESFTSPVDVLYPGAVDSSFAAVEETGAGAVETSEGSEDRAEDELSEDELAFAQHRSARGGWNPALEAELRAQRRQRRLRVIGVLAVSLVIAIIIGVVAGRWWWTPAVVVGALTVLYFWALRTQSAAEKALHRRRVAQLRRARLGVRNAHDEELNIPRQLRHPGAVVLEADDESPDFEFLPVFDADEVEVAPIINRRELRDDLSSRRVG